MIYLDNAATTRMADDVRRAMKPYQGERFENPSARYAWAIRDAVEAAKNSIAATIEAKPEEIYFTSGGTESDNWALRGVLEPGDHVITTNIEHHAITETLKALDVESTYVPVEPNGIVDPDRIKAAVKKNTKLITVMTANNEIGTIQPIEEIAEIARENGILFHTDAVQVYGHLRFPNVFDMVSVSAHKFHGPKGVGFLYVRKGVKLNPLITGGGQQDGMRSGTLNVPGIIGMASAATLAREELVQGGADRIRKLRDAMIYWIARETDGVINGDLVNRLPNNVNVSFPGIYAEDLIAYLEMNDIFVSGGSACTSGSLEPSHVIKALGRPDELARGTIRITLDGGTTGKNIKMVCDVLERGLHELRH